MPLPNIDYVDLHNRRTITVCPRHKLVTCGECCLDFSFDLSSDDSDDGDDDDDDNWLDEEVDSDEEAYSDDDMYVDYDCNTPVPGNVSGAKIMAGRYGCPAPSASRRSDATDKVVGDNNGNINVGSGDSMPPLDDEDDCMFSDMLGMLGLLGFLAPTKHSGTVFPSRFAPLGRTPLSPGELFPGSQSIVAGVPTSRFINRYDKSEFLIYTDGVCSNNGAADARGGCAIVFKPSGPDGQGGSVAFQLEDRGPDGEEYRHSSNRAELRAVVAALRFRRWHDEGFKSLVIATDSSYVVDGATDWIRAWVEKGWRLPSGDPVKNRDLWEALLLDVEHLHDRGVSVRFWRIPREHNHLADTEAKRAAATMKPKKKFSNIKGMFV